MVKNKGFTIIELMIIIAMIGIFAAMIIPIFQDDPNTDSTVQEEYHEVLDAPVDYIRNDKRTSQTVKLSRHSDGTLWACNTKTKDCYMVED